MQHIKTLVFAFVFFPMLAWGADQPPADSHLPIDYPSIVGLFNVHEVDPQQRLELLRYVKRQIAAGNTPDDNHRTALVAQARSLIDDIKAAPDRFKEVNRERLLNEVADIEESLSGVTSVYRKPGVQAVKPAPAVRKPTGKLTPVTDRAQTIQLIKDLLRDAEGGG
jgi:hypothetical protein